MDRREFFKLSGLGAGALFLASSVLAKPWTEEWEAQEAVRFAVDQAMAKGALYADARIGACEILGNTTQSAPVSLLKSDLLGMRICTPEGWRMVVMGDWTQEAIQRHLPQALQDAAEIQPTPNTWIAAHFCKEKVLAHRSSDSSTESELNMAMLRFGQRKPLPRDNAHFRFCDILLHQ